MRVRCQGQYGPPVTDAPNRELASTGATVPVLSMTGATPVSSLPPPGWYPDPRGGSLAQLRWFDGSAWTDHVGASPLQPASPLQYQTVVVPSGAAASSVVVVRSGPNHVLHLILTILTAGLWLPIWILVAIFGRRRTAVVSTAVAGGGAVVMQYRSPQHGFASHPTSPPVSGGSALGVNVQKR